MLTWIHCVVLFFVNGIFSQLPPSPPQFSWDTVPLFMHAQNTSGALNDTAAKYMSTFAMVTVEKGQGQDKNNPVCNPSQEPCEEDMIISALKKIRSYNSQTITIFYMNSFINYPQYRLATDFYGKNEKYLLHDRNGKLLYLTQCAPHAPNETLFDLSQNETRQFWLNTVKYAMTNEPGIVDGIFVDRGNENLTTLAKCFDITTETANAWNEGHISMMKDAMSIVREFNKERGILIGNNADIDTVNARMFENMNANSKGVPSGNDIQILMNENGVRISEAHESNCAVYSSIYNQSLAAYLIGAYQYSYYACTGGWTLQTGWDTLWENADYSKPLGAPKMNATFDNSTKTYYREFTNGVKVWLDYDWKYPCIVWNDNTITGNKTDCDKYN